MNFHTKTTSRETEMAVVEKQEESEEELSPSVRLDSHTQSNVSDNTPAHATVVLTPSVPQREALSLDSSPSIFNPSEGGLGAIPNTLLFSISDTSDGDGKHQASEKVEAHADSTDRNILPSPSAVNPCRSLNPAFSLSPRTSSGSEHAPTSAPNVAIRTQREKSPMEYRYAMGTVEGRQNFTADCLSLIGQLNTQGVVKELLPVMLMAAKYDDSVCVIAQLLPNVLRQLDGLDESTFVYFLGLIINLCCSADYRVLQQIASSLEELIQHVSNKIAENLLLPLLMSMQVSFWSSPRAVAAALLSVFASHPSLVKASGMTVMEWFDCFVNLTRDKSHFVRKAAVSSLHKWVRVAEVHEMRIAEVPLKLVHECMLHEESDMVRYTYVTELVHLAQGIGKIATTEHLQLLFTMASRDTSWRVRYIVAKRLGAFARLCSSPEGLLDIFVALCADKKVEIRAVIIEQLEDLATPVVSLKKLSKLYNAAATLIKDNEVAVRESVAKQLHVLLSPRFLKVYTPYQLQELFGLMSDNNYQVVRSATHNLEQVITGLAVYSHLTRLESLYDADVTFERDGHGHGHGHMKGQRAGYPARSPSVCSHTSIPLSTAQRTISGNGVLDDECLQHATEVLSGLVDVMHVVSGSNNWRIREAVIESLRYFCCALSVEEFVPLARIIRSLLRDPVNIVRVRAIQTMSAVAAAFGPEWAAVMAFDLLRGEFAINSETSYTQRIVAIQCLSGILPVVGGLSQKDLRRQELMQQWVRMVVMFTEDSVSNVRLALIQSIAKLWEWYRGCKSLWNIICHCVKRLQCDSDVDVARVAVKLNVVKGECQNEPF